MILVGSRVRVTQSFTESYLEDFVGKTGVVVGWSDQEEWYERERVVKFDCGTERVIYYEEMELVE